MALAMRSTFKSFDRLKDSGMTEQQARVIVEAIEESADFGFKELATKSDLLILKSELKLEIAEVRTEIAEVRIEIAEVRTEVAEVRTEVAELKTELKADISELKTDINWLKKLFMGGMLLILINIIIPFLHH